MTNEMCPNCFRVEYWNPIRQECRFCGWSPDVALDGDGGRYDDDGFEDERERDPGWS